MNFPRPSFRFLAIVFGAALFVLFTSGELPAIVASHFDGVGAANGFMTRRFYTWFMLALVVGVPLLLVYLPGFALRNPRARLSIRNPEYWLSPERRQGTVDYFCRHMERLGALVMALLCYIHRLVIQANAQTPPTLSSPWFIGGLIAFTILGLLWAAALVGRFREVPREDA